MLTETVARTDADGTTYDIPLLDGFLNPLEFNDGGSAGPLTAAQAAGAIFQGGTRQVGNEIDEFVTEAVRNRLLGLPLDLAVLNIARGRSEGIPPLNARRRQFFAATGDAALAPYASWFDFGFAHQAPGVARQLHRGLRHAPDDHGRHDRWPTSAPRRKPLVDGSVDPGSTADVHVSTGPTPTTRAA